MREKMSSEEIFSSSLPGKNECELCEKSFTYRHHLLRHRRAIHGEKSFECHLCPYKTVRKDMLVSHRKIHTKTSSDQVTNVEPKIKLKFNPHLSLKKLNIPPTLNENSHIKTQFSLPNIHDQKTLFIQTIMNNFSKTSKSTKIRTTHSLNFQSDLENHGAMIYN